MDRYSRQLGIDWLSDNRQELLGASSALIVGCGGMGCVCATYLVRAGIGKLRIVDDDRIGITDLHRQILYDEFDARSCRSKTEAAREKLNIANSQVVVETFDQRLTPENAARIADGMDILIDCSDNLWTRMLINEIAAKGRKPWVHGACSKLSGIVIPFPLNRRFCYRCLVEGRRRIQIHSDPVPILGPIAGIVGALEAALAIAILVGANRCLQPIFHFDLGTNVWEVLEAEISNRCPLCSQGRFELISGESNLE